MSKNIPQEYYWLVQELAINKVLAIWFLALENKNAHEKTREIDTIIREMKNEGVAEEHIKVIRSLIHDEVYHFLLDELKKNKVR